MEVVMTTFNKILINSIENDSISKEDYYKIIELLAKFRSNEKKYINLKKEKDFLLSELHFIRTRKHNILYSNVEKEINYSLNKIFSMDEINIYKDSLNIKKEIFQIIIKYQPQYNLKSNNKKFEKYLKFLEAKKIKIKKEIDFGKEELSFLKKDNIKKNKHELYLNYISRYKLPQVEKEILKQQFYIDNFSKTKTK